MIIAFYICQDLIQHLIRFDLARGQLKLVYLRANHLNRFEMTNKTLLPADKLMSDLPSLVLNTIPHTSIFEFFTAVIGDSSSETTVFELIILIEFE